MESYYKNKFASTQYQSVSFIKYNPIINHPASISNNFNFVKLLVYNIVPFDSSKLHPASVQSEYHL